MAGPAPGGLTYAYGIKPGVGVNREDLSDVMHNIDPWDTMLFTNSPKTRCASVYHEWPEDTLPVTLAANSFTGAPYSVPEGEDFSASTMPRPTRSRNWTQIFRYDVVMSNTQIAMNSAGVSEDMYRHHIANALKAMKRNIEMVLLAHPGSTATGATGSVARQMKRLSDFITTNAKHMDTGAIGGAGVTGKVHPVQESLVNGLLQLVYQAGGNPMDVYVSPAVKRVISSFTGSTYQQAVIPSTERTLYQSIDVYVCDFGNQYIHMDRWVPTSSATGASANAFGTGRIFFLDRTRCRIAFLRNPKHVPIASIGDAVRGMVLTELTLELINEKGHGMIYGVRNDGLGT